MKKDIVYITGHRHPDSDSIISAIAYALFKQRKGIRAIPCRLGELNAETKYLLNRFGFEEPQELLLMKLKWMSHLRFHLQRLFMKHCR